MRSNVSLSIVLGVAIACLAGNAAAEVKSFETGQLHWIHQRIRDLRSASVSQFPGIGRNQARSTWEH